MIMKTKIKCQKCGAKQSEFVGTDAMDPKVIQEAIETLSELPVGTYKLADHPLAVRARVRLELSRRGRTVTIESKMPLSEEFELKEIG